jgi:16S rRNA (guanine1207-N2)-methyltransferase
LAGANSSGIQSLVKDAQSLFDTGSVLGYKKGYRVVRFRKQSKPEVSPAWSHEAGIVPGTWQEFVISFTGFSFRLACLPGIFSAGKLDSGSQLLLENLPDLQGKRVLDLGCGYGILGLAAAGRGAAWVDLVDVDLSAVACTRENLARLGITQAQAFPSDGMAAVFDRRYEIILTNPPFHSGKQVDYQVAEAFFKGASYVLPAGGQLWVVANQFIRYDRWLQDTFSRVERRAQDGKYTVWCATKSG